MLYFIGLGLYDEKDISLKGLEIIKKCKKIYLESYTSKLGCSVDRLEKLYKKKIIKADRELVEKNPDIILKQAKKHDVAFLVVGDPLSATTHVDLRLRAEKKKIKTAVIHNASIFNAVSITGLQLYKFGRVSSIPFSEESFTPETPYEVIKENKSQGLHTLLLLDLKPDKKRFMTVNEAIWYLLKIESNKKKEVFTEDTLVIGCARLGSLKPLIKVGKAKDLLEKRFGKPLHCLIIPGKLHFMEEESIYRK